MWFIWCIKCNLSVLTAILHFNLVLVLDDLSAKSTGQWHSTGFCPSHHLSILLGIHSRVVTHHSIALTWPTYTSVKPSSRFHGHNMFREIGCLLWKKCTIPWNTMKSVISDSLQCILLHFCCFSTVLALMSSPPSSVSTNPTLVLRCMQTSTAWLLHYLFATLTVNFPGN